MELVFRGGGMGDKFDKIKAIDSECMLECKVCFRLNLKKIQLNYNFNYSLRDCIF